MARIVVLFTCVLSSCGGAAQRSALPDESTDLSSRSGEPVRDSAYYAGTIPAGPDVDGSVWRFVEAHCTEGPLDLSPRGFESELRTHAQSDGLLLIHDQTFRAESCVQTIVQKATLTDNPREWRMLEEARVALPATEACEGRMEAERPGEVRRAGEFLEVLVQRSNWCNGFEVRMVYAPTDRGPLDGEQVVRRWVAHFNRRDVAALAGLFAETGSLVDPFTVNDTGGAFRYEGREAVRGWYARALSPLPWLALRLDAIRSLDPQGQYVAEWTYVDPRIEQPFAGRNQFTVAAGEIFETQIEVAAPPGASTGASPARPSARAEH